METPLQMGSNDPKAKAKFQALNEAYEVISDPDKRAKYDQYGEQWKNADAFGGFGGAGGAGGSGSYGGAGGNPFEGFDFSQFGSLQTDLKFPKKEATAYTIASFTYINCIFFFLLLQIFSYVLRLVSRNVLFYESPAGYLL